jgi:hypothetical protein
MRTGNFWRTQSENDESASQARGCICNNRNVDTLRRLSALHVTNPTKLSRCRDKSRANLSLRFSKVGFLCGPIRTGIRDFSDGLRKDVESNP